LTTFFLPFHSILILVHIFPSPPGNRNAVSPLNKRLITLSPAFQLPLVLSRGDDYVRAYFSQRRPLTPFYKQGSAVDGPIFLFISPCFGISGSPEEETFMPFSRSCLPPELFFVLVPLQSVFLCHFPPGFPPPESGTDVRSIKSFLIHPFLIPYFPFFFPPRQSPLSFSSFSPLIKCF